MGARSTLVYLGALARHNIGAALARPLLASVSAAMMLANNLIFFLV